jgi:hypothetical protein
MSDRVPSRPLLKYRTINKTSKIREKLPIMTTKNRNKSASIARKIKCTKILYNLVALTWLEDATVQQYYVWLTTSGNGLPLPLPSRGPHFIKCHGTLNFSFFRKKIHTIHFY